MATRSSKPASPAASWVRNQCRSRRRAPFSQIEQRVVLAGAGLPQLPRTRPRSRRRRSARRRPAGRMVAELLDDTRPRCVVIRASSRTSARPVGDPGVAAARRRWFQWARPRCRASASRNSRVERADALRVVRHQTAAPGIFVRAVEVTPDEQAEGRDRPEALASLVAVPAQRLLFRIGGRPGGCLPGSMACVLRTRWLVPGRPVARTVLRRRRRSRPRCRFSVTAASSPALCLRVWLDRRLRAASIRLLLGRALGSPLLDLLVGLSALIVETGCCWRTSRLASSPVHWTVRSQMRRRGSGERSNSGCARSFRRAVSTGSPPNTPSYGQVYDFTQGNFRGLGGVQVGRRAVVSTRRPLLFFRVQGGGRRLALERRAGRCPTGPSGPMRPPCFAPRRRVG